MEASISSSNEDIHMGDDEACDDDFVYYEEVEGVPVIMDDAPRRKTFFRVLTSEETKHHQSEQLAHVGDLFGVSTGEAFCLLRAFGWDKERLQESWFADEDVTRKVAGLVGSQAIETFPKSPVTCLICLEKFGASEVCSLGCQHWGCAPCWKRYLEHAVEEGRKSVTATCYEHKCEKVDVTIASSGSSRCLAILFCVLIEQIVLESLYKKFCDSDHFEKYQRWCAKSYVDDNPVMRWCPGGVTLESATCDRAILCTSSEYPDVKCICGVQFCFLCGAEPHRPARCKTVDDWFQKNSAESENVRWIIANTKKCPKCHRPIEKNQGCNHMTCSKNAGGCGFEFCWLCTGNWNEHGAATGGYYQCNVYDDALKEGKMRDEESSRKQAKHALDKYIHYYERYMNHERSLKFVEKDREKIETKVQQMHDEQRMDIAELQFFYDALDQITHCRRVLKWSYAWAYYREDGQEKNLFEFLQKNLEENCDHLHELIELKHEEVFTTLDTKRESRSSSSKREAKHISGERRAMSIGDDPHVSFMRYRSQLTNFTNVTRKFLEQMLRGIEQGLTTQDADYGQSSTPPPSVTLIQ